MKRITTLIIITAFFAVVSFAIPAKRGFIDYRQPDGSVIKVRMTGDEHGHLIYSEDGRLLIENDGWLEYAKVDEESWTELVEANRASRIARLREASLARMLSTRGEENSLVPQNFGRNDVSFPVIGEQKGLVILVEYKDLKFTYADYDYFNRMLNEEGFSDFGSLGSARDWFIENSDGKFRPQFDVFGPVELPNEYEYYGKNDAYGNDRKPHMMAIHACDSLDNKVDFSRYDCDGDGIIDNVFIFYAGTGEHDSGEANTVWPHSWDVSEAERGKEYIYDGVKLDHYACTCEYPIKHSRPDGIGTFVHEFSHVMGLPDLYVTTNSSGFTPGEWDALDYGPYNNEGLTPPNYSSFEKCALGWMEFLPLTEGTIELPDFSTSNVAYALPTENGNEFFFFENRQQTGNDKYLPGHGMLVWHVDYKKSIWDANKVNNTSDHQHVDIVEADDIRTDATRSGDSFPGTNNVTSFGFDTTPQLASWAKKPLAYELMEIAESEGGTISFKAIAYDGNGQGSVEMTETEDAAGQYYDLMGRKVSRLGKGIYILNGRKVIK